MGDVGGLSSYYTQVNPDLLALIPPAAGVILEIGCGAGALAEAYRRINPFDLQYGGTGNRWYGIEVNQKAASIAMRKMTSCTCGSIEETDYSWREPEPGIDVLIFGDVLEHLSDPWSELKRTVEWLKPGGLVLACVPNVQHYSVVDSLLRGEWEYQDEGHFDRTHLRWFTLKSIKAMFRDAGLDVFEVRARNWGYDKAAFDAFKAKVNGVTDWRPFMAAQWVIRAVKAKSGAMRIGGTWNGDTWQPSKLHVHAVLGEGCCARPRILEPFAALRTIPGVRCTTSQDNGLGYGSPPAIVIQQRCRSLNVALQETVISQGFLLIAELDDHPAFLEGMERDDFLALRACHAVQVSTEPLAEVVRRWNPNVRVIPNQIAELPPWRERDPDDGIAIFYGAQNREDDWLPIIDTLNRVLRDHPDVTMRVIHDRAFYDALETTGKTFRPFCEYDQYRQIMATCDIALLPLEDTEFNRCKSDLKFLECAAEGCVALTSHVVYGPTICMCGCDCIGEVYRDQREFEIAFRDLINNPDLRRIYAESSYNYVRDYRMLRHHYRDQHAWYVDLMGRKAELDADLFNRVPELAPAYAASS